MSHHETRRERVSPQSVAHHRHFDATAAEVRWAHLSPDRFAKWVGPRGSTLVITRFDTVTGGAFDYTVNAGGEKYRFRGSYHHVDTNDIWHTWEFVGDPLVTLEHLVFTDNPHGGSDLTVTSTYASVEDCDAMFGSDMGEGMAENFSRLDELLAS